VTLLGVRDCGELASRTVNSSMRLTVNWRGRQRSTYHSTQHQVLLLFQCTLFHCESENSHIRNIHLGPKMHYCCSWWKPYTGSIYTAQCTLVQMRGLGIACRLSVCLSVTLVICDHIGWKSWKLIACTISPTPSLFVAKRRSTYSQGNVGKFWRD